MTRPLWFRLARNISNLNCAVIVPSCRVTVPFPLSGLVSGSVPCILRYSYSLSRFALSFAVSRASLPAGSQAGEAGLRALRGMQKRRILRVGASQVSQNLRDARVTDSWLRSTNRPASHGSSGHQVNDALSAACREQRTTGPHQPSELVDSGGNSGNETSGIRIFRGLAKERLYERFFAKADTRTKLCKR